MPKNYRTIVISDVHLGSKWSHGESVMRFIERNSCQTLILCGDIIDDWAIHSPKQHDRTFRSAFFETLRRIARDTRIIYVYGNHDASLGRGVPEELAFLPIGRDAIYESGGKRYYVLHGDAFDNVSSRARWLAWIGDVGYSTLLWVNKPYNRIRRAFGKPYFSIANAAKQRAKEAVSQLSGFEHRLVETARERKCDGVICGHIHRAEIRMIEGIEYLNSGDWVESLSALIEDFEGNWTIYRERIEPA